MWWEEKCSCGWSSIHEAEMTRLEVMVGRVLDSDSRCPNCEAVSVDTVICDEVVADMASRIAQRVSWDVPEDQVVVKRTGRTSDLIVKFVDEDMYMSGVHNIEIHVEDILKILGERFSLASKGSAFITVQCDQTYDTPRGWLRAQAERGEREKRRARKVAAGKAKHFRTRGGKDV